MGNAMLDKHEKVGTEPADKGTQEGTAEDVARIVDSQIDAAVADQHGPHAEGDAEGATAHDSRHEHGYGKNISGMTADKAVTAATITTHNIYEMTYLRVVGGAQAGKKRFENTATDLVGQSDSQRKKEDEKQRSAPRTTTNDEHQQSQGHDHPAARVAQLPHDAVQPRTVGTVELQQQPFVEVNDCVHRGNSDDFHKTGFHPSFLAILQFHLVPAVQGVVDDFHARAFVQHEEGFA